MTLGDLIANLESVPPDTVVEYSDGTFPDSIESWRGVYAQPTLTPEGDSPRTAGELLAECISAKRVGRTGYKGGDYSYDDDSPVWADPYGSYFGYAVMGAVKSNGKLILSRVDISEYH